MAERKNFEMTQADHDKIVEACKSVPMIALQCGCPPSQQENANNAWSKLGLRMGFKSMTVQPDPYGPLRFTAEAVEKHAGEFHWSCSLDIDCPNCEDSFDLLGTDDYGDLLGDTQVCEAKKGIETFCPKCEFEFTFDIGGGM